MTGGFNGYKTCLLKLWHTQLTKAGHLHKETFTALLRIVHTLVPLVKDQFDKHTFR